MISLALPLSATSTDAFAQSLLTDSPAPLKYRFKPGVPLPPVRPSRFEPVNPMAPPKSDIPDVRASTPNPAQSGSTQTKPLPSPLAAPALTGQDVAAPVPKLPNAAPSQLTASIPLPPTRPKDLSAPAEVPSAMPSGMEKTKADHSNPPKLPPVEDLSKEQVIEKASAVLSEMTQFQAEFTQVDGSGRKVTGHLAVARPGRLRFDYDPPSNVIVIADGNNVGVIDRKLKTRDVYSLFLTPLKFLLKSKIDLKNDISIVNVRSDPEAYVIVAEDKSTFAGTSKIALSFDKRSLKITQWTVTDPQGYDTTVILGTLDTETEPDGDLFVIPEKVG